MTFFKIISKKTQVSVWKKRNSTFLLPNYKDMARPILQKYLRISLSLILFLWVRSGLLVKKPSLRRPLVVPYFVRRKREKKWRNGPGASNFHPRPAQFGMQQYFLKKPVVYKWLFLKLLVKKHVFRYEKNNNLPSSFQIMKIWQDLFYKKVLEFDYLHFFFYKSGQVY